MWSCVRLLWILVAVYVLIGGAHSFILDVKCEAPTQCTCTLTSVKCSDKRLPRIPLFNMTSHQQMLYLHLEQNRIIVVPEDSFLGINADKMYIDMSSNFMRDIHPLAFNGIQDKVTILKLDNNLLTTIPDAVANLTQLEYLDVHGNPIKTFDQAVIEPLGGHLEIFYVGSNSMEEWPSEFSLLTHLEALHLFDFTMTDIPENATESMHSTLVNLEIQGSNLTRVPQALCNLKKLVNFYFNDNINLDDKDILPGCNSSLSSVTSVILESNDLVEFPDVFSLFPKISSLSVSSNPRLNSSGISNVTIPESTVVSSLIMSGNNFNEIPQEIGKLTNLRTLDFQSNNITELFDNDLDHLTHLARLILNNNPISTIDDHAFTNQRNLYQLGLDQTKLSTIPRTIQDLVNLHTLDFRGNRLNCSCVTLGWMKNWPKSNSLRINGDCVNQHFDEPIQTFIVLELPRCQA